MTQKNEKIHRNIVKYIEKNLLKVYNRIIKIK